MTEGPAGGRSCPIIRKASAHGLGHLLPPYADDDPPSPIPEPLKGVLGGKEKLKRWQHDVWFEIVRATLASEAPRFDYHPALQRPTASRYTATSTEVHGWYDHWNEGKSYAESVKPLGFSIILHPSRLPPHPDDGPDPLAGTAKASHPVAPYDKDLAKAISQAFDRITGEPIDPGTLETYQEVLAGYPHSEEAKFLNGGPFDRGHTERREVVASSIILIGKEADRWEEEYHLGMRTGEFVLNYGGAPEESTKTYLLLRQACQDFGVLAVARATGIARATLGKLVAGESAVTRIPHHVLRQSVEKLKDEKAQEERARFRELVVLTKLVDEVGLRAAARGRKTDPSNLRRRIHKLRGKAADAHPSRPRHLTTEYGEGAKRPRH